MQSLLAKEDVWGRGGGVTFAHLINPIVPALSLPGRRVVVDAKRAAKKAYDAARYQLIKAEKIAAAKEWRLTHKKRHNALTRRWRKKNPLKVRALKRAWWHRKQARAA